MTDFVTKILRLAQTGISNLPEILQYQVFTFVKNNKISDNLLTKCKA